MAVDLEKKTDVQAAVRFYVQRPGDNVPVITDIIERGDGTVWIVSPLGGQGRSRLGFDDTVAAFHLIEQEYVRKAEKLV